jgi:gamma-glutamylcyclotransferase (GGCT)/AIG2-like uncharacterized protein YtfP
MARRRGSTWTSSAFLRIHVGPAHHALMTNRLFVYGTLRRESRNSRFRLLGAGARFVGRASMRGRLVDLGEYPGLVAARGAADWVHGEVYALAHPARALARLDEYEGCTEDPARSPGFRRVVSDAVLDSGRTVEAWVYVYEGTWSAERLLPFGDYLDHERH